MQVQNLWPQKLMQAPPAKRFQHILNQPDLKEPYLRASRSKYLAMISRIDENIGRILRKLDELKLTGKTIVVFTSSGGFALGDHGLFGEGPAFYDELTRVPLLVWWPGHNQGHGEFDRVVSHVDLAPTFCAMAGLETSRAMQGRSLVQLIENPDQPGGADEAFLEFHRHAAWTPQIGRASCRERVL